jgi:hypothetical protein
MVQLLTYVLASATHSVATGRRQHQRPSYHTLQVDTLARDKSGIGHQERSQWLATVVLHTVPQ